MVVKSTDDPGDSRGRIPALGDRPPAISYLVRFWLEPREKAGETSPLRGYARDLETGEERYFDDPRKFAEQVLRRLRADHRQADRQIPSEDAERAAG